MAVADRHRDAVSLPGDGFPNPDDGFRDPIDGFRNPVDGFHPAERRPTPVPPRRPDEHLL